MTKQIIIKKNTNSDHFDFDSIINSVELVDIVKYIIELDDPDKNDWIKDNYWYWYPANLISNNHKNGIHTSELEWAIFSYLVHNNILVIEKKYYNPLDDIDKYVPRTSYYNPLEAKLYVPILARLEKEGYLIRGEKIEYGMPFFKISKKYQRIDSLKKLGVW